jgi:hypothetical protein
LIHRNKEPKEIKMTKTVTATTRKVMREFGKREMYTNKYVRCRTVKCYASDEKNDEAMIAKIKNTVSEINGTILDVSYNFSMNWRGMQKSIIIRFPL